MLGYRMGPNKSTHERFIACSILNQVRILEFSGENHTRERDLDTRVSYISWEPKLWRIFFWKFDVFWSNGSDVL
jgi:hypothetical protein